MYPEGMMSKSLNLRSLLTELIQNIVYRIAHCMGCNLPWIHCFPGRCYYSAFSRKCPRKKSAILSFCICRIFFYCIVHRDITFAGSGLWSCLLDSSTLLPGNCLGDMDHVVYVIYISPLQSINLINSHTGTKGKAKELIQPFIPCTLQKCLLFFPG